MLARISPLARRAYIYHGLVHAQYFGRYYVQNRAITRYEHSPNFGVIEMLDICLQAERALPTGVRNNYKIAAFANAIGVIGAYDHKLTSGKEASHLVGIGPKISERIQMYLEGDHSFIPDLSSKSVPRGRPPILGASKPPVPLKLSKPSKASQPPTPPVSSATRNLPTPQRPPKQIKPKPERKLNPQPETKPEQKSVLLTDRERTILSFMVVPGLGHAMATKVYDAGCRHVDALALPRFNEMLSTPARTGFRFRSVLNERVSYEQAEPVVSFVREHIGPGFVVHLTGSHRRGAPNASTIDLLLFHPSHTTLPIVKYPPPVEFEAPDAGPRRAIRRTKAAEPADDLLQAQVVKPLSATGLLSGYLSNGPVRWRGIARIPLKMDDGNWEDEYDRQILAEMRKGTFVRLDMKLLPWPSRAAGLIAHTGDQRFVYDVQYRARKMGLRLNEFGLWRWSTEASVWEALELETEAELLQELGMEYVEPTRRNFQLLSQ